MARARRSSQGLAAFGSAFLVCGPALVRHPVCAPGARLHPLPGFCALLSRPAPAPSLLPWALSPRLVAVALPAVNLRLAGCGPAANPGERNQDPGLFCRRAAESYPAFTRHTNAARQRAPKHQASLLLVMLLGSAPARAGGGCQNLVPHTINRTPPNSDIWYGNRSPGDPMNMKFFGIFHRSDSSSIRSGPNWPSIVTKSTSICS